VRDLMSGPPSDRTRLYSRVAEAARVSVTVSRQSRNAKATIQVQTATVQVHGIGPVASRTETAPGARDRRWQMRKRGRRTPAFLIRPRAAT